MFEEYGYTITDKDATEEWTATEYKILNDGSGGGTFAKDSSQATVVYLCEYNFVERFLEVVLGKTVKVGSQLRRSADGSGFGSTSGSLPEEHPYFFNFFAATAEVEPVGKPEQDPSTGPLWPKARVTVVFRPPTYNVLKDGEVDKEYKRFTTVLAEGSADIQTSQGFFKFVATGRQLDLSPGQTIASQRLTYTWHQIPVATRSDGEPDLARVPNLSTIQSLAGKVNSSDFDGYGAGSVLFITYQAKLVLPQVASANNYFWDISYVFGVRDYGASPYDSGRIGWNFAFDPTTGQWDLYTSDGTTGGRRQYLDGDLNQLFDPITW